MRVSDRVRKCVVFIGKMDHGPFVPYGTGFLVMRETDGWIFRYVVTARHVIQKINSDRIYIRINKKSGEAEILESPLKGWLSHPNPGKRKTVDVAVISAEKISHEVYDINMIPIEGCLSDDDIVRDDIGAGCEVFMTGLFTRHWGEYKTNTPIVRYGNIAWMEEGLLYTPDGYMEAHLIEAKSIGGLSGSPVFVHMLPYRYEERPDYDQIVRSKIGHYFFGMIQGHFVIENPEDALLDSDESAGKINTGIAVVIPARKIAETVDHPVFVAMRAALVDAKKRETGLVYDASPASGESSPGTERAVAAQSPAISVGETAAHDASEWFDPEEAARRRDATLRRMLATPPKPQSAMKLGRQKRGKPEAT